MSTKADKGKILKPTIGVSSFCTVEKLQEYGRKYIGAYVDPQTAERVVSIESKKQKGCKVHIVFYKGRSCSSEEPTCEFKPQLKGEAP